jgi:hypothetical protein
MRRLNIVNHHLPDLALAASNNGRREALLGTEINPKSQDVSFVRHEIVDAGGM